jgi:hypothetical protein
VAVKPASNTINGFMVFTCFNTKFHHGRPGKNDVC